MKDITQQAELASELGIEPQQQGFKTTKVDNLLLVAAKKLGASKGTPSKYFSHPDIQT